MRHKKLSCSVCKKVFTRQHNLERHSRVHTGEKSFMCSTCGKKFTQKAHLKAHETTNSDERKYRCDICVEGRFFKIKGQLSTHLKLHFEP